MTFTGPIALGTLGKLAVGVGALLVVAYILKLRRRRHEVPFSKLWQRVLGDKQSSSLWHRLKRLLSLLLAMVIAGVALFAATGPELGNSRAAGHSIVIIIDASASMKTHEKDVRGPTRLDAAKVEAKRVLKNLGGADAAMIMRLDGQPAALSRFDADGPMLAKVVDGIAATDTAADLPRALGAAADALRDRPHPMIVIIGDGAYQQAALDAVRWEKLAATPAAPPAPTPATKVALPDHAPGAAVVDLSGIDVSFIPVGEATRNVGIVAFNVRRYFENKMAYEVLVELQNFGADPEHVRFTLQSGAETLDSHELDIAPGQVIRQIYPDVASGNDRALTARIAPAPTTPGGTATPDDFPLDDVAYALLPEARHLRILVVTDGNKFLEGVLFLDPNLTVDVVKPADYAAELAAGKVHEHDVVMFDDFTPPELPPTESAVYFHPSGDGSPIASRATVKDPFFTDQNDEHPVMKWVLLNQVRTGVADVLVPQEGDLVLASSIRDPLIVVGKRQGKKVLMVGFSLHNTDLVMRPGFPVMMMNTLDWFAGNGSDLASTYRTGRVWHVPVEIDERAAAAVKKAAQPDASVAKVHTPDDLVLTAPIDDGAVRFFGTTVGIYRVEAGGGTQAIAANLSDPLESSITPHAEITMAGKKLAKPPELPPSLTRSIWLWLALTLLGLLLLEWWTYNRRVTV